MIYPGTDLKWRVTVAMSGFDITEDDMELVITDRYGNERYSYSTSDFIADSAGGRYFTMPDVTRGMYYARLTCHRHDYDFGGWQKVTDIQHIATVGEFSGGDLCVCHNDTEGGSTDGMEVHYERVWTVNLAYGIVIADENGNPILESSGNPIRLDDNSSESRDVRLSMTAEEFKQLMESRNWNGTVDTLPEAIDALSAIGDDTSLSVMSDEDTESMMDKILNR